MVEQLADIIKNLDPALIKKLEESSAAGLKQDKITIYQLFVKDNPQFTYEKLNAILTRHQNGTIDINWSHNDWMYRIVISKRKIDKEKKEREAKDGRRKQSSEATSGTETKATGT